MPPSRIVISSESEKSFSFAVKNRGEERNNGKRRTPYDLGARCFMQTCTEEGGSVPLSRIVISSESEKSFSFAVKNRGEERNNGKRRTPPATWEYGVSCRRMYTGKRKRQTKKIPRLRSG